jgi:hypothetical protein
MLQDCLLKQETAKNVQFLVESHNRTETTTSVMEYNKLCSIMEAQLQAIEQGDLGGRVCIFKSILAHEGPLAVKDLKYKGSLYNVLIEWDSAEPTWEPLNIIANDNPLCAQTMLKPTTY